MMQVPATTKRTTSDPSPEDDSTTAPGSASTKTKSGPHDGSPSSANETRHPGAAGRHSVAPANVALRCAPRVEPSVVATADGPGPSAVSSESRSPLIPSHEARN